MDFLEKYRLELEEYANNSSIKREDLKHIINEDLNEVYKENDFSHAYEFGFFELLGDEDLKKYEKWLINGEF